jgi:hypothetical protein
MSARTSSLHVKTAGLVLGLSLLGAIGPAFAGDRTIGSSPNPGVLKTKVQPDDAGIYIDGEYAGHADRFNGPRENLFLPPGEHEVRVSLVYYKDYVTKVTIQPGEKTVIRHAMEPSGEAHPTGPFGRIKIDTPKSDLNAAVIVDGMHVGYADQVNKIAQTLLLLPGEHKIELLYAGYQPYVTTITVEAGKKQILRPTLTPR